MTNGKPDTRDTKAIISDREKIIKQIVDEENKMSDDELLLWAMCQLRRAAKTLDLVSVGAIIALDAPPILGAYATAEVIEKKLKLTAEGRKLLKSVK